MPADRPSSLRTAEIVVGIAGHGLETCRSAVRLAAEEAALRRLPLRLVHGSRPDGREGLLAAGMEWRQQRGRRLVSGAAQDLAGTALGRGLQIRTESTPRTGVDLLLTHSRTAVLLVLQRGNGWDLPAGPTIDAVTSASGCPTLVVRTGGRPVSDVGVLVVLDPEQDPGPAIVLGFVEASLRGVAVTVLDGRGARAADRGAVLAAGALSPGVAVRHVKLTRTRPAVAVAEASAGAALVVVVRPDRGAYGLVAEVVDVARCPVLMVAAGAQQCDRAA